ncbi:conserved hypothetical protein [uncultured Paludibacter sp.]|nr:conserved hypothetical protein [uncultured Paludibacter sp.]
MKNYPENITIKQIAKLAGVSAGTVDRVLHNRGKVSVKNLEKINKVLQSVDYKPNIIASALASNKIYRLAAVIPVSNKGEYWELVSLGMDEGINEFRQFGVQMEKIFFDQYDSRSMKKVNEILSSEKYDGVVLAVLFKDEFAELSDYLSEINIPFIYMDFNLLDHKQLSFYGTDSFSGGKLSARMLLTLIGIKDDILIVLLNAKNGLRSNQSLNRERGFLEYLENKNFQGKIHRINLEYVDKKRNDEILNEFFSENKIKGVIVFNSTCHIVAQYFKEKNISDIVLVGYDGIEENINMMKEDFVDVLIAQRPYYQGYEATKSLCNYLLRKTIPPKENYIPLDILVRENVDFYNFQ